jgi:predicted DNA-binding transcriptional regulator YafY
MTLIFKGYAWYLFGFCYLKKDYRMFRLSRMKNLIIIDQQYKRKNAVYKDFFTSNETNLNYINMKLKFSSSVRVKVEDYFDEELIEFDKNQNLIVKINFPDDEWVYTYLLSFGENLEVLEPESIRQKIRKKAEKIVSYYN